MDRLRRLEAKLDHALEEAEQAVLECAEGTVTGAEKAQKRLEALLTANRPPSTPACVCPGGQCQGCPCCYGYPCEAHRHRYEEATQ